MNFGNACRRARKEEREGETGKKERKEENRGDCERMNECMKVGFQGRPEFGDIRTSFSHQLCDMDFIALDSVQSSFPIT